MPYSATIHAYVKAIYDLRDATTLVTNQRLAAHFGVSPPAVTDMVKKLEAQALVCYTTRKGVALTEAGEALALRLTHTQTILKHYLRQALGMTEDEVRIEAAGIEHVISQRLEAAILRFLSESAPQTVAATTHPIF